MADVRISLEHLHREGRAGRVDQAAQEPRAPRRAAVWVAAAIVVAAVSIAGTWLISRAASRAQPRYDLRRITADSGLTFQPTISPDGTLVAYASDRAGNGNLDIWVQQISGGQPIQLTTHGMDDFEPAFSPDGSQIAFRSDRGGGGIFIVPSLGGNVRMLANQGHMPRFSPDGRLIAFRGGDRVVGTQIFIVGTETGGIAEVPLEFGGSTPTWRYCYQPIWSPDGTHLMFATGTATSVDDWWVVPADGGVVRSMNVSAVLTQGGLLQAVPHAWRQEDSVIFSATAGDSGRVSLWELGVSPDSFEAKGPPVQLTFGTGSETQAAIASTGRLVFTGSEYRTDLWSVPVGSAFADATGKLQQITRGPAAEGWPTAASNGTIAYIVNRTGKTEFASPLNEIWLADLATRTDHPFVSTGNHQPALSPDGTLLVYGSQENGRNAIYRIPTSEGIPKKVCDDCGAPTDVAPDGRTVLRDGFSYPNKIGTLDLENQTVNVILQSGDADLYSAQFSPDGRWLAFHARASNAQTRQILIAPFEGSSEIPRSEWVAITDGSSSDAAPQWSGSGDALYFLSDRDGFQCLWAQRLDLAARRPVGDAAPISHFHQPGLSATAVGNPGIVRPALTGDRVILTLAATTGNIWMMEPRPPR